VQSSSIAQHKDYRLIRPAAYHWDLFLLGLMSFGCGVLGLPLVNGVLPQVGAAGVESSEVG